MILKGKKKRDYKSNTPVLSQCGKDAAGLFLHPPIAFPIRFGQELLRSADQRLDDLHRLWQQTNEGLSAFSDDEQTWVKNITAMFSSDRLDTTEKVAFREGF